MKRHHKIWNFFLLVGIVFCVQQSELLTPKRIYGILMVTITLMLYGVLFNQRSILKLMQEMYNSFDERDIDFHQKGVNNLSIATIICLVCIIPLLIVVNKDILSNALIILISLYILTYLALVIILLISVKSIFYDIQPTYREPLFNHSINSNISNNLYIDLQNTIFMEEREQVIVKPKKAIFEEIFYYSDLKKYLPVFKLIDVIYIKRKPDKVIAGIWFDTLAYLTGGNRESIRTTYNKNTTLINNNTIDTLCKALKTKGDKRIKNIEEYIKISTTVVNELISNGFKFSEEKKQGCILLLVLYISYIKDEVESPILPECFDSNTKNNLFIELKNFKP
jgi:hypothetical protein